MNFLGSKTAAAGLSYNDSSYEAVAAEYVMLMFRASAKSWWHFSLPNLIFKCYWVLLVSWWDPSTDLFYQGNAAWAECIWVGFVFLCLLYIIIRINVFYIFWDNSAVVALIFREEMEKIFQLLRLKISITEDLQLPLSCKRWQKLTRIYTAA